MASSRSTSRRSDDPSGATDESEATESADFAEAIGLRYTVSGESPSITRRPWGRGFTYLEEGGSRLSRRDPRRREIEAMALPPAWSDVWISGWSDGHLQATGHDQASRKQYRYHDRWLTARRVWRDDRLAAFAESLPRLREHVDARLAKAKTPTSEVVHAAAVRLLDHVAIRVGNERSFEQMGTRGLTTLRNTDAELTARRIRLSFVGKGRVEREVELVDPELAEVLRRADDLDPHLLSWTEDGETGFVTGASLNRTLKDVLGEDAHSHLFRSWQATVGVVGALRERDPPDSERAASSIVIDVTEPIAERLGHTVATCREHYVHHAVEPAWRAGRLREMTELTRSREGLDVLENRVLAFLQRAASDPPEGATRA